jgi:acetoin utilization protein AcuB
VREGFLVGLVSDRDLLVETGRLVPEVDRELGTRGRAVHDVLQPDPLTIGPAESLASAAERMATWGVGALPVTRERSLEGILTETDVLEAFAALARHARLPSGQDPPVRERMTGAPQVLAPEATLAEAARRMQEGDFRHLPVVDGGRLMGILSERDLRRAARDADSEDATVAAFLTPHPLTATPSEPLSRAARRMASRKVSSLPVVEAGRVLGILTTSDVLRHCGRLAAFG